MLRAILRTALLSCIVPFSFVLAGFAEDIAVRVVDVRSGRELGKQPVWIRYYQTTPSGSTLRQLQSKTGDDGVAHFHLPAPAPSEFVLSSAADELHNCGGYLRFATQQVVSAGAVAANIRCGNSSPSP